MRKWGILAVMMLLALGVFGCAETYQQVAQGAGQWDLQNAATSRQLASDLLKTWPINSGFIRAALGVDIKQLPVQAVEAMDRLDEIAAMSEEDWTDRILGESLGLRVRMLAEIVIDALQRFAPKVLSSLPIAGL